MGVLSKWRDSYVVWHAKKAPLPVYFDGELHTQKIHFSGRVQKVGFRLELFTLATRLSITGTVRNLKNGDVEAVLQGPASAIHYVIDHMYRLKRANVVKIEVYDMEPISMTKFEIAPS